MNAGAYGWCMQDALEEIEIVQSSGVRWVTAGDLEWGYRFCRLPHRAVVTAARIGLRRSECSIVMECQRGLLRQRREKQPRSVRTFGSAFKNPRGAARG